MPLSVLDVVPIVSGSTSAEAVRNALDLARQAEGLGLARYWLTEHHLNEGIAGSQPHVLLAALAQVTEHIRLGTAATLVGNYHLPQVAETFGVLDALAQGRVDLGLGRSGSIPAASPEHAEAAGAAPVSTRGDHVVEGIVFPAPRTPNWFGSDRFELTRELFGRTAGDTSDFDAVVDALLELFAGTSTDPRVGRYVAPPAAGAHPQLWLHGSSAGISARVAGEHGLPFGSNYHTAPANSLDAITEYRRHFRRSRWLDAPYVIVSADVVVADDAATAEHLGQGYAQWVHSIRDRRSTGAIAYPTPEEAAAAPLDDEARVLVHDRETTRFVGAPEQVVERLAALQRVTGADELLITTIVHDHALRVRSYELLAEAWGAADAPLQATL
ncbi:LLM class flavin-dependent oxidoreductase [Pseudoclavibacter soli]|uniref:LLM class flavin-dependent oxidoreductase n=1 Tax=Pseudoclavibacter soli TaxID=452623 RepID=UPI001FDF674B|nr:LLM class flavin-dependent oxidoreductase [Pseudoclavibacter soli]